MPAAFVKTRIVPARNLWLGGISLLAVAIPLLTVTQPFIDKWSWRQSDVAAIARNYTAPNSHFAYPRIDWAGGAPGYVGTEFPILPYLAGASYRILGIHEWIGRIESLIFFAVSIPFFVALVRERFGESATVWALIFYGLAPLTLMTSRCFIPDMPSLSLSLVGLYFFMRWLQTERWPHFAIAAVALSFSFLIKLPTAIIGAPMACLVLQRFGWGAIRRPGLWVFGALVLVPSAVWYWHAARAAAQFFPHHFFGAGGVELMPVSWYLDIVRRIIASSITIVPLGLAAAGLWLARKDRAALPFYSWLAVIVLFVIVVGYGNRHPWYQLALVPVVAAFAGYAMARLVAQARKGVLMKIAVALIILAFAVQSYSATRKLLRPTATDLRGLGLALKDLTPAGSLIIVADYGDPTGLYYGERKGWHFTEKNAIYNGHPNTDAEAIADLEYLRLQGATHIAFYSGSRWWLNYYSEFTDHLTRTSDLLTSSPSYQVYKLRTSEPR